MSQSSNGRIITGACICIFAGDKLHRQIQYHNNKPSNIDKRFMSTNIAHIIAIANSSQEIASTINIVQLLCHNMRKKDDCFLQ